MPDKGLTIYMTRKNVRYYLSCRALLFNYTLIKNHTTIGHTIDLIKKKYDITFKNHHV
jgi:hypothetical protein